jgi:hypothetical protein
VSETATSGGETLAQRLEQAAAEVRPRGAAEIYMPIE